LANTNGSNPKKGTKNIIQITEKKGKQFMELFILSIIQKERSFVIDRNDLEMGYILGKGSFGEVVTCKYKPNSGSYAAKKFSLQGVSEGKKKILIESFENELKLMKKINHNNIVTLFGYSISCFNNINKILTQKL
jgi:hypothetical protein